MSSLLALALPSRVTQNKANPCPSCLQCPELNRTAHCHPDLLKTFLLGHDFTSVPPLPIAPASSHHPVTWPEPVSLACGQSALPDGQLWAGPGRGSSWWSPHPMEPSCSFSFSLIEAPCSFSVSDITSQGSKTLNHIYLSPIPRPPHAISRGSSFPCLPHPSLLLHLCCLLAGKGALIISCLDDRCSLLAGLLASSLSLLPSILHALPDKSSLNTAHCLSLSSSTT